MIKNVLMCGIGAVGCIYADKIQAYNPDILKILVDKKRLERYKNNPMKLNDKELVFDYVLPENNAYKADLIIITTKFDGLQQACENIKNFVKEDTIIISLLNGVVSEDIIAKKYGWDKVLLSYWIGHSAMRVANEVTHDGFGKIFFGSKNKSDKNIQILKEFFDRAAIEYVIPEDMEYNLWLKFMLNVSTNQSSAVSRETFGQMQNNPKTKELILNLMKEVQKVAKAEGVKNTENMIEDALNSLSQMSPDGKTSMLQDVLAKRKTEVDIFAGTIIELAKKHNLSVPYNEKMKEQIEAIHRSYQCC